MADNLSPTGVPYPEKSYLDQLVGKAGLGAYDFLTGLTHMDPVRKFRNPVTEFGVRKGQRMEFTPEGKYKDGGVLERGDDEFTPGGGAQEAGNKLREAINLAATAGTPGKGGRKSNPNYISEKTLKAIQSGDEKALSRVLRDLLPMVKKSAAHLKGDPLYQDAIQEGLRSAIQDLKQLDPESKGKFKTQMGRKVREDITMNIGNLRRPVELPDHIVDLLRQADQKANKTYVRTGHNPSLYALSKMLGVEPEILADAYRAADRAVPYYESQRTPSMAGQEGGQPAGTRIQRSATGAERTSAPQESLPEGIELRKALMDTMNKRNMSASEKQYFNMLMEDPEKNAEKIGKILGIKPISGGSDAPHDIPRKPLEPLIKPTKREEYRTFDPDKKSPRLINPITKPYSGILDTGHPEGPADPAFPATSAKRMREGLKTLRRPPYISGSSDIPISGGSGEQPGRKGPDSGWESLSEMYKRGDPNRTKWVTEALTNNPGLAKAMINRGGGIFKGESVGPSGEKLFWYDVEIPGIHQPGEGTTGLITLSDLAAGKLGAQIAETYKSHGMAKPIGGGAGRMSEYGRQQDISRILDETVGRLRAPMKESDPDILRQLQSGATRQNVIPGFTTSRSPDPQGWAYRQAPEQALMMDQKLRDLGRLQNTRTSPLSVVSERLPSGYEMASPLMSLKEEIWPKGTTPPWFMGGPVLQTRPVEPDPLTAVWRLKNPSQ